MNHANFRAEVFRFIAKLEAGGTNEDCWRQEIQELKGEIVATYC
jgi:hypothetical protein